MLNDVISIITYILLIICICLLPVFIVKMRKYNKVIKYWSLDKDHEKKYDDMQPLSGIQTQEFPDEYNRRFTMSRRSGIDRRKASMKYAGLDIDKGIERFNGDRDIYFKVLSSYITHTRELLDSIENICSNELEGYANTMHTIKGTSRGIFADMLGDAADNLETAAVNGDFGYIATHNVTFLKAAWKLIFDLEDLIANMDSGNPKPLKEKPDDETLLRLLDACRSYNMDEVDNAMTEIEKYRYRSGDDLASWLIMNIKLMNFKEIVEKLSREESGVRS